MNEFGKKIDWVLLLSLVVIVGGVVFLVFMGFKFGLFDSFLKNSVKKNDISALETKYCDYAKKTLDWMDKTRMNDGKYPIYVNCDQEKKECSILTETGPDGNNDLPILWARYKYFLKTQDQEQLLITKKDIDIYFKESELVPIKSSFWNCRILTEMRDEKILGVDYVKKLDNICKTSQYLDTENVVTDNNGQKKIIVDLPYLDGGVLSNKDLNKFKKDKKIDGKYFFHVTYPSDFVARYKTWNDKNDLDVANAYFNKLMIEYYLGPKYFLPQDKCLLAVSSLDLYSVNKDERYLLWSKIIHQYFFKDKIEQDAKIPECALLNRELTKYDDSVDYKLIEDKLFQYFIENYWDGDGGKNEISGKGGFLIFDDKFYLIKNFKENALIVNLLCS